MAGKDSNTGLGWFLGITLFVTFGVSGYALYEYYRIQKINATTTTPSDAIDIINKTLQNG